MSTEFVVTVYLILSIITGSLTCHLAVQKAHRKFEWFLIGFFFGIIGLIAATGLPDRKFTVTDVMVMEKELKPQHLNSDQPLWDKHGNKT